MYMKAMVTGSPDVNMVTWKTGTGWREVLLNFFITLLTPNEKIRPNEKLCVVQVTP